MTWPAARSCVKIDARLDAEAVQQVHDVLARDVAGRALGVRAAAEPRHRAVERRDADFHAPRRRSSAPGRKCRGNGRRARPSGRARRPARIAPRSSLPCRRRSCRRARLRTRPSRHSASAISHDVARIDLAFVRTAEHARNVAAHAHAMGRRRRENGPRALEAFLDRAIDVLARERLATRRRTRRPRRLAPRAPPRSPSCSA